MQRSYAQLLSLRWLLRAWRYPTRLLQYRPTPTTTVMDVVAELLKSYRSHFQRECIRARHKGSEPVPVVGGQIKNHNQHREENHCAQPRPLGLARHTVLGKLHPRSFVHRTSVEITQREQAHDSSKIDPCYGAEVHFNNQRPLQVSRSCRGALRSCLRAATSPMPKRGPGHATVR